MRAVEPSPRECPRVLVKPGSGEDEVEIRRYPDGPMLVRGPAVLVDEAGRALPTRDGTFAVCRCGRSRVWPTCDGTHRFVTLG